MILIINIGSLSDIDLLKNRLPDINICDKTHFIYYNNIEKVFLYPYQVEVTEFIRKKYPILNNISDYDNKSNRILLLENKSILKDDKLIFVMPYDIDSFIEHINKSKHKFDISDLNIEII